MKKLGVQKDGVKKGNPKAEKNEETKLLNGSCLWF